MSSWSVRQKEWYQENIEREREKRKIYAKGNREAFPEKRMFISARDRAKEAGLPFNIEVDDIIIPTICPILKVPLVRKTPYAPSLDRIEPYLGYIKGNVWVISRKANVMKNNATREELKEFAAWINQSTS